MRTHGWFLATLGGLATAMAFQYALVEGWMGRYVPDAPATSAPRVVASVAIGGLLLVATAVLAARWSGVRSRAGALRVGAVAGLLAGGLTFALYGAPAAGAAGARLVYPFVVAAAPVDVTAQVAVNALFDCAVWT